MDSMTKNLRENEGASLKDYFNLVRNNLIPITVITLGALIVSVIYALSAMNIYKSSTSLKISKPQGSLLTSSIMPDIGSFADDRFIATEIEIMKSYNIRARAAKALIDSFKAINEPDSFYLVLNHNTFAGDKKNQLLSVAGIAKYLEKGVTIEQKRGIDIVDISVSSPSAFEAAVIANCYASAYSEFNLSISRTQLTSVKGFLAEQTNLKQAELRDAEETLSKFQTKNGIIALDEQSSNLITQLATFEAQRDNVQIESASTQKEIDQLKEMLKQQNPKIADYLESLASQSYFQALQDGIAKLEVNKDLALSNSGTTYDKSAVIKQYDEQIKALKQKLVQNVNLVKMGIFASNPEEIKDLTQKILEAEVKGKSLSIQLEGLNLLVNKYDSQFNKLPVTAIEYAGMVRKREALEKLFALIEEKYQEAVINEQSQPGNVIIVDEARTATAPDKPNRILIVIIGFILGGGMAFGYVFIKNYFDNTIKTPEDIQGRNINVLAWVPQIEGLGVGGSKEFEFIVSKKPDSIPSEAFRALRTRVQFSKIGNKALKTILITSSAPSEGKTTVCVNLAGTFAQSNKKVLIIDCDLRKPRIHTVFNVQRFPGLVDHLFNQAKLEEVIRHSEESNLDFIPAGTIPPNPSETLESTEMREFLKQMTDRYDLVLLDSPPIIAVTDSEILASIVDASILVVSAGVTEYELMEKSVELIKHDKSSFIGTVLNNFSYKAGYGSYYKYYYYYSKPENGNSKIEKK